MEIQTLEQRLAVAKRDQKKIEHMACDWLVKEEGWIQCSCGCGAVKRNDGIAN